MRIGNAIGSVICNTALIAALTIAIRPSEADRRSLRTPVIFFFIAAVFLITYYLCVQGFPLILAAGLFDGSVAVVLTVLRRRASRAAARRAG